MINTSNIIYPTEKGVSLNIGIQLCNNINLPINLFTRKLDKPSNFSSLNNVSMDLQFQFWTWPEMKEVPKIGSIYQPFEKVTYQRNALDSLSPKCLTETSSKSDDAFWKQNEISKVCKVTNPTNGSEYQIENHSIKETVFQDLWKINSTADDFSHHNEIDKIASQANMVNEHKHCFTSKSKILNQYPHEVITKQDLNKNK